MHALEKKGREEMSWPSEGVKVEEPRKRREKEECGGRGMAGENVVAGGGEISDMRIIHIHHIS
jgi:hypothetical protein